MAPVRKLLNVCQGDRNIEVYARDFMGVARQSAMEKACLMVFFWGGLAEPFKSRMPYWHPKESMEEYINLALILSGSAFRVEWAVEPAPVWDSTESAPEPAPRAHRVRSRVREPTEPSPFREPTESAPEPALDWEPTESTQETAPLKWLLSAPSRWRPTLPAPPWHPCLPIPPGSLPLHVPGPPSLPQIQNICSLIIII